MNRKERKRDALTPANTKAQYRFTGRVGDQYYFASRKAYGDIRSGLFGRGPIIYPGQPIITCHCPVDWLQSRLQAKP